MYNYYYAVGYKDKDGFFEYSVDKNGRLIVCDSHYSAIVEMEKHIIYIDEKLNPKKDEKPKRKFLFFKPKENQLLLEYRLPEHERLRLIREKNTLLIKKVRILG